MAKKKSKEVDGPPAPPRWLVLGYAPVTLFSLRSTTSTSKGGKALLVPTPYAVKMALIDAIHRGASPSDYAARGRGVYDVVKDRRIRLRPPADCVVQNTFVKIRQEERGGQAGHYVPTIAYREVVFLKGKLDVAIDASGWSDDDVGLVREAAMHVNYFGKRGSFFQFVEANEVDSLPSGFTIVNGDQDAEMPFGPNAAPYRTSQFLDDFGPDLCKAKDGYDRISTFGSKPITLGKHRMLVSTLIPYRTVQATRSFTRYSSSPESA
jgi:hypothetical protein